MPGSNGTNGFLDLPARPSKPRSQGITHVIDKGLALRQVENLFDTAGEYVDIVKLGWGTSYVTHNLKEKIELYRRLAAWGARLITVPAAFTMESGRDHWEVLVRTRAIENQVYVLAAAQCGSHPPGHACYGNSMIVDPWGTVVARAGYREGVVVADIDLGHAERIRKTLPALAHRRADLFTF